MKKLILLLILGVVFADFAIAEEVAAEAAPMEMSFSQVVLFGGAVGIIVWSVIFTMWPAGTVLGIFSCIASGVRKTNNTPLSFKWLMIAPMLYFFIGATWVMWSTLRLSEDIVSTSMDTKTIFQVLPFRISNALYMASFTLFGMVPFIFFIILSVIVLHVKSLPPPLAGIKDGGGDA